MTSRSSGPFIPATQTVLAKKPSTVRELIDAYMAAYDGRDTTRPQRLAWWAEAIGALALDALDDDPIFDALETLERRQSRYFAGKDADGRPIFKGKDHLVRPATINRYAASLAAVFTWAIKKRLVPRGFENPCHRIERRPENNERVRFLSDDERERLFAACRASRWPRLYLMVLMAITTGARRGELQSLRWRNIDIERATAYLDDPTQIKNGDRKVLPLLPAVLAELERHRDKNPDVLIFGSSLRPARAYNMAIVFAEAMKVARVRDFRFHDLRHSCASYLAQNGATLLEIADVLGHRQLSVTKRYSHLTTQHKAQLMNRVLGEIR